MDDFGHVVRMISALPFSPPDQLEEVFNLLTKKASEVVNEKLREFSVSHFKTESLFTGKPAATQQPLFRKSSLSHENK